MYFIFVFLSVIGICIFVPIFCTVFPKAAIPLIYLHCCKLNYHHFVILVRLGSSQNFSDFSSHGILDHAASDFYIKSDFDGTPLGTWHIRPNATHDLKFQHSQRYLNFDTISNETPIFLYFHGMGFDRAHPHRVEVYKLLSRLGYHVMTIDYRGFGNSGGYPEGEMDVVADAISLLRYARSLAPHSPVFIWGSSLGTGIAGSVVKVLNETSDLRPPEGIVLDAPFTNLVAAAYHSPQGKVSLPQTDLNTSIYDPT
ncbi:unnamed protein product [Rodentolepis nana]|uniref:Lysophosphatidylserine lipase ABHD12 n=1 Tax=Rodentolepis nana TaxID=102285 RepID=A0A0R3TYF0_RODNA|nr:unnamed protein product [Rodentolepis nana]